MKSILSLLLIIYTVGSQAQPFSAYTNIRQEFYVFDNGAVNKVEPLLPLEYKVGRSSVAYVDNARNFKIYRDGNVMPVTDLFTTQFDVSDNLILYKSAKMISVVDGNDVVLLSRLCDRYALGDSVVLFYDINQAMFKGYYNGQITELENFLSINETDFTFDSTVKVSDNIGAYINYNDQFKVFYNNQVETLENQAVRNFQVGRNTVGYVDINNQFKIFHKGQTYTIDPFAPNSFMVGDDVVAFYSNDGNFKIFYNGNLYTIGYYNPNYKVTDRVVAFADPNGWFKVFYEGEQIMIDNYYPDKITAGYNSLAYVNKANILRMFSKGKVYDITSMSLMDMRLDYDVLQFKVGFNAFKMFYNGEYYN
ncbi:MAG TPA: hypothetical protein PLU17_03275 [Chitinophagaceae bacterium]|jgi:hypothetical protein|nr:hypothetical protein [Chitinophagaceae bacterium]